RPLPSDRPAPGLRSPPGALAFASIQEELLPIDRVPVADPAELAVEVHDFLRLRVPALYDIELDRLFGVRRLVELQLLVRLPDARLLGDELAVADVLQR